MTKRTFDRAREFRAAQRSAVAEKVRWDTSSLPAMEATAKGEEDGTCSLKIRGEWLEVATKGEGFTYKWGKNFVSREVALSVHRSNW